MPPLATETKREFSGGVRAQGRSRGAPAEKTLLVYIQSPKIASDNSKFFACVLKSGGTVPPIQKVGHRFPSYPRKLRL